MSSEDNKLLDLEPRSSQHEKLFSGQPNRSASCSPIGWLHRFFSAVSTNSSGNKMYLKGRFTEALKFYDQAIELSPDDETYHNNRAAALSHLGHIGEAVTEFEQAIELNPYLVVARRNLALILLRLGQVDNARKHVSVIPPGYYTHVSMLKQVEKHLNECTNARRREDWTTVLKEASAAIVSGAVWSPQLAMCKVEALLKLQRLDEAQAALTDVPKVEPFPASLSQTRFFDMICVAYTFFVKSQMDLALGRLDDAAEAAAKASELDPHNIEIKIFKKNVELIQSVLSYIKVFYFEIVDGAEAARDYEILRSIESLSHAQSLAKYNKAIANSLSQAQDASKQSRR